MLTNWYMFGRHWSMYVGDTPTGVLHMVGMAFCAWTLARSLHKPARKCKTCVCTEQKQDHFLKIKKRLFILETTKTYTPIMVRNSIEISIFEGGAI